MQITADQSAKGNRLDSYLKASHLAEYSREYIIKQIKNNSIKVNNIEVKAGYILKTGDIITIMLQAQNTSSFLPQNIPIDVVYEDDHILVINKQRGLVVHPGAGNHDNTLVNALMHHTSGNLSDESGEFRPGIVHRIDKDTSGLIVAAKTNEAHQKLSEAFRKHDITREYLAICEGIPAFRRAIIDKPLSRSLSDRRKIAVDNKGKNAVSEIEVIETMSNSAYVRVTLRTGRTHQIRVHMKSIGHPLVGDTKYGRKHDMIEGQALHAAKLGFIHPLTEKYLEFYAEPPKDFLNLMDFLKKL